MTSQTPKNTSEVFSHLWPWFFFAAAFESLIFGSILFSIPSESGLSLARFALMTILLLAFVLSLMFGLQARHHTAALDALPRAPLVIISTLLSLTSGLALFLLRYLNPERLLPIFERLSPLLWFLFLVGIQSALFLLFLQNGFHPAEFLKRRPVYLAARFPLVALLLGLVFVALTKLGVTPDPAYWAEPGVAILGWHFGVSLLIGFCLIILILKSAFFRSGKLQNFILPFGIWLTACVLWLSVPWDVLQSSFYAPITPPANIPFPYSDAGFYDYSAQSLLIGADYSSPIPPRPLYILFLTGLHALFGQNYIAMITAQTLVLALFPVALYFLAKKLHSPGAGLTVALFAIFREYLGLWISSNTRVVNSKIFTTDFPTALGIAVLCLVVIWWFERRDLRSTLVTGGAFGLLLLIRTQSLLILPIILVLAWFVFERRTKPWLAASLALFVAVALTVAPWMVHNYTVSGKFAFDDPSQMAVIFSQYSFTDNNDLSQFNFQSENLGSRLITFALANPGFVAGFIANHFLHTEIGGMLVLPLIEPYNGLFAPVNLYWVAWDGSLTWYNLLLIVFYLGILAVGVGAAWHRLRWIGLIPLAFNLGYALSNGIARFSGWRYNMPVDWVIYFYFAIGVIEILGGVMLLFGAKVERVFPHRPEVSREKPTDKLAKHFPAQHRPEMHIRPVGAHVLILAVFAFAGALPWLATGFVQPRYTATNAQLIAQVLPRSGHSVSEIESFLSQSDAVILEGRLLYPRMYRRGQGISSAHPWAAYAIRDYARMSFLLLNQNRYNAIFITREPLDFPQGADTIVLGCQADGYIETRLIHFYNSTYRSAPLTDPCN